MRYLPHGAGCCPLSGRWWIISAKSISEWKRISFGIGFSRGAPPGENIKEKSPRLRTGSHLEYGGEGGLTRFARPCGAARSRARGLSNWLRQLSNPGRGFSSPPSGEYKRKEPVLAYRLSS
ncbi:hypothetical protein KQS06HV_50884 [Klebsiella quasipneumoniae subsp. similipneumoniae]|nr:hypothetical protein KQS06HV_50884 [Klebsiella quasipneumoniae subsp. similipneumoniae]